MIAWPAIDGSAESVRSQAGHRISLPPGCIEPVCIEPMGGMGRGPASGKSLNIGTRNSDEQFGQSARLPAAESASASIASQLGQRTSKSITRSRSGAAASTLPLI
jgi:hypothetical protein